MITVLAGINGAGKSSIAGEYLRSRGAAYYNPDEVARQLIIEQPRMSLDEANGRAWQIGYELLNAAIDLDDDFAFETTLGGTKIFQSLMKAITLKRQVRIFFVGLTSPELHIERVRNRVRHGGHPIDEEKIRQRWENSRANVVALISCCHSVNVFDNSLPLIDGKPQTRCLFKLEEDVFVEPPIKDMPEWAKPLAASAMKRVLAANSSRPR